jgi:hypothetical protein
VVAGKGTESQSEAFFSLLSGLKAAFWSAWEQRKGPNHLAQKPAAFSSFRDAVVTVVSVSRAVGSNRRGGGSSLGKRTFWTPASSSLASASWGLTWGAGLYMRRTWHNTAVTTKGKREPEEPRPSPPRVLFLCSFTLPFQICICIESELKQNLGWCPQQRKG